MSDITRLDGLIEQGKLLSKAGHEAEAIAFFENLTRDFPDNPLPHYELACAFDYAGREEEAAPHYQTAIELGVSGENLKGTYLGYGSTLRNLGRFDHSVEILTKGCAVFPDYIPMRAFLALSLHSAGKSQQAVVELLESLLTYDMDGYERALRYYTDELK